MAFAEKGDNKPASYPPTTTSNEEAIAIPDVDRVNASGHVDQLRRQYGLLGLTGMAVTVNNAWVALASSISVSILSGGPSGLIYGLVVAVFYYAFIGASVAELASSFPSSGGVYHWANLAAGPRHGRMAGFFTGWLNLYGWMFGLAALAQVGANAGVQLYAIYADDYTSDAWQVFIAYLVVIWIAALLAIFANSLIPYTQYLGLGLVLAGGLVTIVTIVAMPERHSSARFVWDSFSENNLTGWGDGVAFMIGVMNGAFTICTIDAITHMAEEVKDPERSVPAAIFLQIGIGGVFSFAMAVALGYAITDLGILQTGANAFPLAAIYEQATSSRGATFGLVFIILISALCCVIGTTVTNSRIYWTLARDNAVPFSSVFAHVDAKLGCPVASILFVAVLASGLGAIPIGSPVGFSNLTGSFIVLSSFSYSIPFICNLATGRRHFPRGPFNLKRTGFIVNGLAVAFTLLFGLFFCFPFTYPVAAVNMNYNCVILAGVVALAACWWLVHARKNYPGPTFKETIVHDDDH